MVYITGDKHCDFSNIEEFCEEYETTREDIIIILGDVGINFWGEPADTQLKEQLSELPVTLFCIHGNHEKRPESISSYEEAPFAEGVVYVEPEYPNLLFAKDGEVFRLGEKNCLVIGGAFSVDKDKRKTGVNWWPDEQPSEEIKERVERTLAERKWKVEVVLSHTCPYKYRPTEQFFDRAWVDNSTEEWLDEIEERLQYNEWWCGHFHTEKFYDRMRFLFENIEEFEE